MVKFLVVNDELVTAKRHARWLERTFEGADVRLARIDNEALRILKSFTPTLVVTDLRHPGGSGENLLTHLRAHPKTYHVPVVLVSGAVSYLRRDLHESGFDAVLPEPCGYEEFINAVNQLLSLTADPDISILSIGEESPGLRYRASIDLQSDAGRTRLAQDVLAIANYGGGSLVIGVSEVHPGELAPVGVSRTLSLELEAKHVNKALAQFLEHPIVVAVKHVRERQRLFVILKIPGSGPQFLSTS